jgi:hypothetical protein
MLKPYKFCKKFHNKELVLINDTKTRWNSLHDSAIRFLSVIDCVVLSLDHKDINKSHLWSNNDTVRLRVSLKFNQKFIFMK